MRNKAQWDMDGRKLTALQPHPLRLQRAPSSHVPRGLQLEDPEKRYEEQDNARQERQAQDVGAQSGRGDAAEDAKGHVLCGMDPTLSAVGVGTVGELRRGEAHFGCASTTVKSRKGQGVLRWSCGSQMYVGEMMD